MNASIITRLSYKQYRGAAGYQKIPRKGGFFASCLPTISSATAAAKATASASAVKSAALPGTRFLRTSFVYRKTPPIKLFAVKHFNRLCSVLIGCHLDKTESFRTPGHPVHNNNRGRDGACLRKRIPH